MMADRTFILFKLFSSLSNQGCGYCSKKVTFNMGKKQRKIISKTLVSIKM